MRRFPQYIFCLATFVGTFIFLSFAIWLISDASGRVNADYYLSQVEGRIVDSTECGDGVSLKLDSSEGEYWLSSDVLEKSVRFERDDGRIGAPSWADESGASLLAHAEEEDLKVVLLFHRGADETAARKVESVGIYLF